MASLAPTDQLEVWSASGTDVEDAPAADALRDYGARTADEEARAEHERPADPAANWSGWWWSTPPTRSSTRQLSDGTPAGLWFVEDSMGWERAVVRRVSVPADARVYEVDGAQAWAELCRRFPRRGHRPEASRLVPHHRAVGAMGHPRLAADRRAVRRRPPHRGGIPRRGGLRDRRGRRHRECHRGMGTRRNLLAHRCGRRRCGRFPKLGARRHGQASILERRIALTVSPGRPQRVLPPARPARRERSVRSTAGSGTGRRRLRGRSG